MSDALKKSIVDAIEEGQLKLGYREETIRLYYPLSSLCTLMHQSMDAAEMTRALTTFSEQVKGELGEIEVALHSLAGMQAAACLYDAARDRILCVYAGGMEPDALAKDLRKLLPKYMLPNLYEKLEALPYNANGKIDRVALKERYLHAEG